MTDVLDRLEGRPLAVAPASQGPVGLSAVIITAFTP
jgi:hypothetical protein